MCVQTIDTEQDCLYLDYLNNCLPDRAYPPLRMYENANFVIIDAADNKQISISKVSFEVDINGETYTDKTEAMRQLAIEIQCVNNSRTGDVITQVETIIDQLSCKPDLIYVDVTTSTSTAWAGFPITVNNIEYDNGTSSESVAIAPTVVNDMTELVSLFNENITAIQTAFRDATTFFLQDGAEAVSSDAGAFVEFIAEGPAATFTYGQPIWKTEPDPNISAINKIQQNTLRNNLKKLQCEADDLVQTIAYLDAGDAVNRRVDTITYTSALLALTVTETFAYGGGAGDYYVTSITLS